MFSFIRKFQFSLRSLLLLFLVCSVGLSIVVAPRLERQRLIDQLDKEPVVGSLHCANGNMIDRLLDIDGPLEMIWFSGRGKNGTLTKEVFEVTARLSPLYGLDVFDLRVEPCARYPRAEYIAIRFLSGEQVSEWLSGLLAAQHHTKEIVIENVPSFSDKHIEILSGVDSLESISITDASVSGVTIRELSKINHEIEIIIENCPITNDGLKAISECSNIKRLRIGFSLDPLDRGALPDLRLLMRAPRRLELELWFFGVAAAERGDFSDDPELERTINDLDEYFGNPVSF